jgi:hypothetical protein
MVAVLETMTGLSYLLRRTGSLMSLYKVFFLVLIFAWAVPGIPENYHIEKVSKLSVFRKNK